MASRFVKDSGIGGDADDIVQESLLVLWRQTENGYEMQNPEALAVAITKKMCLAHLRGYNPVVQSIDGFDVVGGVSGNRHYLRKLHVRLVRLRFLKAWKCCQRFRSERLVQS